MIDIQDRSNCPTLEEIGEYVNRPVFLQFCADVQERYRCKEQIEFSACSWEYGWNIKFRKSGKSLCTVYPREQYFTVLVVVGQKEKNAVERILQTATPELQEIYEKTKVGNNQKWLMIDLEDKDAIYDDIFRLMDIRRGL